MTMAFFAQACLSALSKFASLFPDTACVHIMGLDPKPKKKKNDTVSGQPFAMAQFSSSWSPFFLA